MKGYQRQSCGRAQVLITFPSDAPQVQRQFRNTKGNVIALGMAEMSVGGTSWGQGGGGEQEMKKEMHKGRKDRTPVLISSRNNQEWYIGAQQSLLGSS